MLRAYDYTEYTKGRSEIQDAKRFNEELWLAKAAVDRVLQLDTEGPARCPGCGSAHIVPFFVKWGAAYLMCSDCASVFTEVGDVALEAYQQDEALVRFRSSPEYQDEAAEKRMQSWQETLDWIRFRCFRHLGRHEGLTAVTGGDRYTGFAELMRASPLCSSYRPVWEQEPDGAADIAVSLNLIQRSNCPEQELLEIGRHLAPGGLLFLSARLGTGFDVLVLREHAPVYPYEYVSLLSQRGLEAVLARTGFEILDLTTPGHMDVGYVHSRRALIPTQDLFVRNLIFNSDPIVLGEFQRFLQKSGMSSYAHIVAKKVTGK